MSDPASRPLEGLKILELARILAGPWIGQVLADLGADVVKIERKGAGDDTRAWGPPFVAKKGGGDVGSAYFHSCNRGKRSIEADFDNPDDIAMIRELAMAADVVVENFKLGGLIKYGLDAAAMRAMKPELVYCSITGFGQTGPYAPRAGYDFLIQGMAGAMDITGQPDGQPTKAGYAMADIFTGMYATTGILAALRRRDATGEGATIDCALLDSQVAVLANQAMNYLVSGASPTRMGNAHPNIVPYAAFPTQDDWFILAVGNDAQFARFCEVVGIVPDPDFGTNAGRLARRDELEAMVHAATSRWPRADLLAALEQANVPAGPINSVGQAFADPQIVHRGMQLAMDDGAGGVIPGVRLPIRFSRSQLVDPTPAPRKPR